MTERTVVKSIESHPQSKTAFIVSGGSGVINKIPPISVSLDIQRLPGLEVGDILTCSGRPYMTKNSAIQSNHELLKIRAVYNKRGLFSHWRTIYHRVVQVGESAWAVRKINLQSLCA